MPHKDTIEGEKYWKSTYTEVEGVRSTLERKGDEYFMVVEGARQTIKVNVTRFFLQSFHAGLQRAGEIAKGMRIELCSCEKPKDPTNWNRCENCREIIKSKLTNNDVLDLLITALTKEGESK